MHYNNGDIYEGQFQNGKRHGQGNWKVGGKNEKFEYHEDKLVKKFWSIINKHTCDFHYILF